MVNLIKNVTGIIHPNNTNDVIFMKKITSEIGVEDSIEISGLNCFLQNLSRVEKTALIVKPIEIGLNSLNQIEIITLEINY